MDEFERAWHFIEPALEYSGGTHTKEDIRQAIERRDMLLITGPKSAMVFEVIVFPQMKVLHGFLCGGDLQELKSADPSLMELARALGCSRISIAGRYGWARALKDLDYTPTCTIVSKEVQ